MAGLLFMSKCVVWDFLIVLIAVSTQLTCIRHRNATRTTKLEEEEPMNQDNDEEEEEKGSLMDSSNLSEIGQEGVLLGRCDVAPQRQQS